MSTFIIHLLIPPLMVLATGYFRARYVWAWIWVGVIGDIDYVGWWLYVNEYVPVNTHRAILHNLWIFFLLAGISYARFRRFKALNPQARAAFQAFVNTPAGAGWVLSAYYYFSHLLLDSIQGGIVPLWPVVNYNVFFEFALLVDTRTQQVIPHAEGGAAPGGAPEVSPVYAWLDSEQFAFLVLLSACLVFAYAVRRYHRHVRHVRAVRLDAASPTMTPASDAGRKEPSGISPPKTSG